MFCFCFFIPKVLQELQQKTERTNITSGSNWLCGHPKSVFSFIPVFLNYCLCNDSNGRTNHCCPLLPSGEQKRTEKRCLVRLFYIFSTCSSGRYKTAKRNFSVKCFSWCWRFITVMMCNNTLFQPKQMVSVFKGGPKICRSSPLVFQGAGDHSQQTRGFWGSALLIYNS